MGGWGRGEGGWGGADYYQVPGQLSVQFDHTWPTRLPKIEFRYIPHGRDKHTVSKFAFQINLSQNVWLTVTLPISKADLFHTLSWHASYRHNDITANSEGRQSQTMFIWSQHTYANISVCLDSSKECHFITRNRTSTAAISNNYHEENNKNNSSELSQFSERFSSWMASLFQLHMVTMRSGRPMWA